MAWFLSKQRNNITFTRNGHSKLACWSSALQHKFFETVSMAEVVAVRVSRLSTRVNKIAKGVEGTLNFWHVPVISWRKRANPHEKPTNAAVSQPIFEPGIYQTWHERGAAATSPGSPAWRQCQSIYYQHILRTHGIHRCALRVLNQLSIVSHELWVS
jgi:hypothetical protein